MDGWLCEANRLGKGASTPLFCHPDIPLFLGPVLLIDPGAYGTIGVDG